jgi:uncharacterized membrane protein YbhN (UPF0104 family)
MTTRLGLASRFHDATESLRGSRIFTRLGLSEIPRASYAAVDEHLKTLGKGAHPIPALLILVAWLLESVESWIILRALGVEISWVTVLSFDAALSVVRTAAAFAPAGLGAQDLGYLAFFEAYGIPNASAIGPAFLVLKRTNQLVWVAIGFTLLMLARKGPAEPAMEAA